MANIVTVIKKGWHFATKKIWEVRLEKIDKRQVFLVKQLRIFSLSIKGFNEDKCLNKAAALTFYTLFSIVPIVALLFAISKGFGFEKTLEAQIINDYQEYSTVLNQVFLYANTLLETAKGGVIAGAGVILLLWSVMNLFINIENSFNEIWEIKKGRSWFRKITDYLTMMVIAPIFLFISGSLTVIIKTQVSEALHLSFVTAILLKLIAFLMICLVFAVLYMVLPNTKVSFKSAFFAGLIAAGLFELLEWVYLAFQIGAVKYNAIYGSFAALPLFLIWVQYSWYIVLFGAELAFAYQNIEHYELENEIQNMSVRYKRVLSLMICNVVVKNFNEGNKALTAYEIAQKLDLPTRLARILINELIEVKLFSEVKTVNDKDTAYQPAISDSKLTVNYVLGKLNEKGVNELPISNTKELSNINRLLAEMDEALNNNKGNALVKDIA